MLCGVYVVFIAVVLCEVGSQCVQEGFCEDVGCCVVLCGLWFRRSRARMSVVVGFGCVHVLMRYIVGVDRVTYGCGFGRR